MTANKLLSRQVKPALKGMYIMLEQRRHIGHSQIVLYRQVNVLDKSRADWGEVKKDSQVTLSLAVPGVAAQPGQMAGHCRDRGLASARLNGMHGIARDF